MYFFNVTGGGRGRERKGRMERERERERVWGREGGEGVRLIRTTSEGTLSQHTYNRSSNPPPQVSFVS